MRTDLERPTVFDAERQKAILEILAAGNYLSTALAIVGITSAAWNHWEKRWRDGDPTAVSRFGDFFDKVRSYERLSEANALADVKSGRQGWQGPAWFLERRFPQRWGKGEKQTKTPTTPNAGDPPKPRIQPLKRKSRPGRDSAEGGDRGGDAPR